MKNLNLNTIQKSALSLIQNDLRYLFTVIKNIDTIASNYIPSLLPYIGVIIDGAEKWIEAINNSNREKLDMPLFSKSEKSYYETVRNSIKIWENDYSVIYKDLENAYNISDNYFGSICKPIVKKLHLYDIFGVDGANGVICGNTILCYYYNPLFSYDVHNGEYIKAMSIIAGKYISFFDATKEYLIDNSIRYDFYDYGGLLKSPVGNTYSYKFVLFSILCQINFIIYCVDCWIKEEISTKLRFAYLLYYSLLHIIPQINVKMSLNFFINTRWKSKNFRNAMAHYKLGVALKKSELIYEDQLFGLTYKYFKEDYLTVKNGIICELENLEYQIGDYLKLKNSMISFNK